MKFLPLMTLYVTHPYYADERCPDFRIEPTLETQRLLKNHRCVLKPVPNGVRVLMATTNQRTPFIPLEKDVKFAFQLHLHNPDFALFTDLTEITPATAPLYTNANFSPGSSGQLELVSRRAWTTESFVVRQPAPKDCFTLSGRPLVGLEPADFSVEGLGASTNLTHYDATSKVITVNSKAASKGDSFKVTYETAAQQASGIFADVEIHYNDSGPEIADGPREFQIAFKAKSAIWKYYIIADGTSVQFRIEDKKKSVVFSEKTDDPDDIAKALADQYPDMQLFRFVSDDPIACQKQARKSIQLYVDDKRVVGALPNPSLRNYSTMEVIVNGKVLKEDTLFRVIKYFTPSKLQSKGG